MNCSNFVFWHPGDAIASAGSRRAKQGARTGAATDANQSTLPLHRTCIQFRPNCVNKALRWGQGQLLCPWSIAKLGYYDGAVPAAE